MSVTPNLEHIIECNHKAAEFIAQRKLERKRIADAADADEKKRWREELKNFQIKMDKVLEDIKSYDTQVSKLNASLLVYQEEIKSCSVIIKAEKTIYSTIKENKKSTSVEDALCSTLSILEKSIEANTAKFRSTVSKITQLRYNIEDISEKQEALFTKKEELKLQMMTPKERETLEKCQKADERKHLKEERSQEAAYQRELFNSCEKGGCSHGGHCVDCGKKQCFWRIYGNDRLCYECEQLQFDRGERYECVYRP